MDVIGVVTSVVYQFCTNAAFLLLCALGLIVILGMMNIINLAHGELMMMGAYAASASYSRGAPFWLAAIIAFVAVGIFGAVLEVTIVRRFYGRELGALVVTWGVSLVLSQGFLLLFGPFMPPIQIPEGNIALGQYSFSYYWIAMFVVAALLVAALWWIYNRTDVGLQARATMQNPTMARALGVDTRRIYMMTFTLGAALAGLSGALLAPTTSIMPFMGQQFVASGLHHRRRRRGDKRHRRRGRQQPPTVPREDAGRLLSRRVSRDGGAFALGAHHHQAVPDGISAAIQRRLDLRHRMR